MRASERIVNLLLICAGFGVALLFYDWFFHPGLGPRGMIAGSGTSVLAFWLALELRSGSGKESAGSWWVVFIEQFCLGTGVNLLLHAFLTYSLYVRRTPILIASGGLLASALITLYARWTAERGLDQERFLLVGFDPVMRKVIQAIRQPIIGVIGGDPVAVTSGIPYLGGYSAFEEILKEHRPTNIVVDMREWSRRINPSKLMDCRLRGIEVEGSPALYERLYRRICCERLRPGDLLLSSALRGNSRTIAVQSVYTNVIGLSLLLLLSPVILLTALSVTLFAGPGPVFEDIECAGFQYIPFRLLRFRTTRHDGTAKMTGVGRWITRLRMANVPQLFNVVRGDMALVGPTPARLAFARYLTEVMPFYSHRFSVKPGMIGWAQSHSHRLGVLPDECLQIEYDLFYVKEGSLWMDIEIMLAALLRITKPRRPRGNMADAQSAGL